MNYIYEKTMYSSFMIHPDFLFDMNISETAKNVYVLLLNRARLSQKNYANWHDKSTGKVYSNYTIATLAKKMHKSPSAIKNCLKELREADLIDTIQVGACKPNKIYVKIPAKYNSDMKVDDLTLDADLLNGGLVLSELEDGELPF